MLLKLIIVLAIANLPEQRYILKYKNWLVLLGVDVISRPQYRVKALRLWVIDFEYELTQLDRYGQNYKLNWQEVPIEGSTFPS